MQKSRLLSIFLCVTLLFLTVFVPGASATVTQGRITGDGVRIRKEATTKSDEIKTLSIGTVVTINSKVTDGQEAVPGGGKAWYNVTYNSYTGYVYGKYVEEITPAPYDADFEKNLLNFPESYRQALRDIHNAYPNWIFKADPVNLSLDEAINLEYSASDMTKTKKWVELNYGNEWRDPRATDVWENGSHIRESWWTFASRQAIAFFMDPRNALALSNEKSSFPNIFTFMEQGYDAKTQTAEGLKSVVANTFLDTPDYITSIMNAANESGVSPYVIASTIITEQGVNGTSGLISGQYPGYEGYYNFFNYGAYGSDVIKNGLEYAKKQGWNSISAAIAGGAKEYGSGYISKKQDTYYYMDFNVNYQTIGNTINHQYASSLYDQCVKASGAKKGYVLNTNGALTFRIPVYKDMPEKIYAKPTMEDYASGGSQSSDPPPVEPARRKGDYDGDGQITVKELATIRMYLLGIKDLSVLERSYLDVTGDNEVTVTDMARVRMYLLDLINI